MKRLMVMAVGLLFSISLVAAANAAPPDVAGSSKHQGIKNAKKAMQGKAERDKKVQEVQKKGQKQRKQAQSEK